MSQPAFPGRIAAALSQSEPWWPPRATAPSGAPNVVVMVVDDMGFSDLGCFGSEIPTPHLDAVAGEGLRLANFHVTPTCSPTRASLLTGCNPHAVGMGAVANVDPGFPGYASELPANQPTLAETLRAQGYSTMLIGKWHLCKESDLGPGSDRHSWPLQRGFDQFYGFLEAQTNFFHPHQLYEGNSPVDVDQYPEGYYLTDDLTDRAVRMVTDAVTDEPDKPFLLYYGHGAVHTPLHAKADDIARFRGRYDEGWDVIRERRFARQKELGLIAADAVLPPVSDETGPHVPNWADLDPDGRRLAARYQEVYAAMVRTIDESVGRIREALARLGQLENTIFVFLSDNGAADGGSDIGKPNHLAAMHKPSQRAVAERVPDEIVRLDEIGGPTTWPANPLGWATTANTPFRRHKFSSLRGGNQVSCLVSWPAGLGGVGGGIRTGFAHVTDVMPTLLDLTGVAVLTERQGLMARPMDGVSLADLLRHDAPTPHTEQYLECLGERAYYRDGWEAVAVRKPVTPFASDRWALYELDRDPTQLNDLAAEHPELVAELKAAWAAAAEQNQVLPMADGTPMHWFLRPPSDERFARDTVLWPGSGTIERFRSAQLIDGRSFTIEVALTGYADGDAGVLVSHGGQEAGYVLYVEDGHLVFAENAFGQSTIATDPVPMPAGARSVEVRVHAPGGGRWLVDLAVDGEVKVSGTEFLQLTWLVPFNGINVGIDRRSPVIWALHERHGTFPWTGDLTSVTYRPGAMAPDAFGMMIDHFRNLGRSLQ